MTEPTISCPKCGTEIRLTESLAAPLIAATRLGFERRLADKEAQFEAQRQEERKRVAAEESQRARLQSAAELDSKARELADLQQVLQARTARLAEAQAAQAAVIKKQRELDDARRELDLTVEKRIEAGLALARSKARQDAEDGLKQQVLQKDQTIVSMQRTIEELRQKAERGS